MSAQVAQGLLSRGLSKPSLFEFMIPRNPLNMNFGANDYLKLFCKTAFVPEVTHDVMLMNGHSRQGVVSSQPYGVKYNKPLSITVIERSDYFAYGEFMKWFQSTVRTSEGGFRDNGLNNFGAQRMIYRDEYTCRIILKKFELPTYDKDEKKTDRKTPRDFNGKRTEEGYREAFEVEFDSSYITSIGDIRFGTDARDSMVEYDVTFYYDSYKVKMGNDTRT